MVDTHARQTLEDFVDGVRRAADLIQEVKPDIMFYPIRGAVPLVDLLHIVGPSTGRYCHEYVPASSTIVDTNEVIYGWFRNFLGEHHIPGQRQTFLSLDEVMSGSSTLRVWRQMRRALMDHARERGISPKQMEQDVCYKTIGIEDMRQVVSKKQERHTNYLALRDKGVVLPVQVQANLVMDRPELCPLVLASVPGQRYHRNLPVMEEFRLTTTYLDFLQRVATVAGQDLSTVDLQRPAQIRHSERFIPPQFRSLDAYCAFQAEKEKA